MINIIENIWILFNRPSYETQMLSCPHCNQRHDDPEPLGPIGTCPQYRCARCGFTPLIRRPEVRIVDDGIVTALVGAGVGGAIAGLPGASIGFLVGALVGRRK